MRSILISLLVVSMCFGLVGCTASQQRFMLKSSMIILKGVSKCAQNWHNIKDSLKD